jgi:hypothetical protein
LNSICKIYTEIKKPEKEKKERRKKNNIKRASGNPSAQYGEAARSPARKPNRYSSPPLSPLPGGTRMSAASSP